MFFNMDIRLFVHGTPRGMEIAALKGMTGQESFP